MPIESLTAVNTQSRNVLADLENHEKNYFNVLVNENQTFVPP